MHKNRVNRVRGACRNIQEKRKEIKRFGKEFNWHKDGQNFKYEIT